MTTSFLQKTAQNNDKDFQIAKLKAQVFDLRQKARDYQRISLLYTELSQKQKTLSQDEDTKQADLRADLQHSTTTLSSLNREVDELRAIQADQNEKITDVRNQIEAHQTLGEGIYQDMEKTRSQMVKASD